MDLNDVVDALKSIESSSRSSMAEMIIDKRRLHTRNDFMKENDQTIKRREKWGKWSGSSLVTGVI